MNKTTGHMPGVQGSVAFEVAPFVANVRHNERMKLAGWRCNGEGALRSSASKVGCSLVGPAAYPK